MSGFIKLWEKAIPSWKHCSSVFWKFTITPSSVVPLGNARESWPCPKTVIGKSNPTFRKVWTCILLMVIEYAKCTGSWMWESVKGRCNSHGLNIIFGISTRLPAWLPPRTSALILFLQKCHTKSSVPFHRRFLGSRFISNITMHSTFNL